MVLRFYSECDDDHWEVLSKSVKLSTLKISSKITRAGIWRIDRKQGNPPVAYFSPGERCLWLSPGVSRADVETWSDSACTCLHCEGRAHQL